MSARSGSLFSGVAGLDQAAAEVFGVEPAWFCDNDPAAGKVLAYHYPGVPILGDITAVDWSAVEPIELLTAGWPCQPWSTAGKRRGVEDERALWPEIARALRALRPRIVAMENVPRIVTAGELGRVADTLAALGYRFAWTVLGADEVGAPHRRNRCFILAVADSTGNGRKQGWSEPAGLVGGSDAALGGGAAVADPDHIGPARPRPHRDGRTGPAHCGHPAADTASQRHRQAQRAASAQAQGPRPLDPPGRCRAVPTRNSDWGVYADAVRRWEHIIGRAAPVPRVAGPRGGMKLNPALPEFMMGFPAGWITDVSGVSMNDALRLAGNAVCPPQAVAAFRWLLDQLDGERAA